MPCHQSQKVPTWIKTKYNQYINSNMIERFEISRNEELKWEISASTKDNRYIIGTNYACDNCEEIAQEALDDLMETLGFQDE